MPAGIPDPKRGKAWPPKVRDRARELLEHHRNATLARDALHDELPFTGKGPSRSTLVGWAKADGIDLDNVAPGTSPKQRQATGPATEERLARLEVSRQRHSEMLLEELSRPAASLLKARLDEADAVEELVTLARERYVDAVKVARQADDLGPDAVKGANLAVRDARRELELAAGFRINVRDLVGIITRSITDHLALEGIDRDEEGEGDLIVELVVPKRAVDVEPVPAAKLPESTA